METFYSIFDNPNRNPLWWSSGYLIGFLILIFSTILLTSVFYLYLGRRNSSFSSKGKWFLFLVFNILVVGLCSLFIINNVVFEEPEGFNPEVGLFAIINGTIYAIVFFFVFSMIFNNFSLFSRFVPFNLFKNR